MKLGVDFGTTRTVVACADRGNYPVVSFYDDCGDAHDWYPSVVAEQGGELFFGFDALALAASDGASARAGLQRTALARSFKRLLSDPGAVPGRAVCVGQVTLGLGDLVTRFLGALRAALETRSNLFAGESAPLREKKKAQPAAPRAIRRREQPRLRADRARRRGAAHPGGLLARRERDCRRDDPERRYRLRARVSDWRLSEDTE